VGLAAKHFGVSRPAGLSVKGVVTNSTKRLIGEDLLGESTPLEGVNIAD
jgi:hypothetical protein